MTRQRGLLFFVLLALVTVIALVAQPSLSQPRTENIAMSFDQGSSPDDRAGEAQRPELFAALGEAERPVEPTPTLDETFDAPSGDATPTPPAISVEEVLNAAASAGDSAAISPPNLGWNPPSLEVPLARHPYDHYWFVRPVASDNTNSGLDWYPYGADGPGNNVRVHHGVDLSNPVGVEVRAAGDGTVIWAGRGHVSEEENITVYGNTVVIEHTLGYEGQPLYTLYAHMSAILVENGQRVQAGDVIGLIGATGQVSGPHVHFEVRLGNNLYRAVRNPDLWLAPYVGTGVIAGHVRNADERSVHDVDIAVIDFASGLTTHRVTTYASSAVSSDDQWNENFVIPNVPVGRYLVSATAGNVSWTGEVTVVEGMTNWVDMEIYAPNINP